MEAVYLTGSNRLVCVDLLLDSSNVPTSQGASQPNLKQLIDQLFHGEASLAWVSYVAQLNQMTTESPDLCAAMIIYFTDLPSPDGKPFLWINIPAESRQELVNSCLSSGQWRFLANGDNPNECYIRNTVNGNTILCPLTLIPADSILDQDVQEMKTVLRQCGRCHRIYPITTMKFFPANEQLYCTGCCQADMNLIVSGFRPCHSCLQFNIQDDKKQCKECYQAGKSINTLSTSDMSLEEMKSHLRKCQGFYGQFAESCKKIFYAEEEWKKQCIECFKASKNRQSGAPTGVLGDTPVVGASPDQIPNAKCNYCLSDFFAAQTWMKTCRSCYVAYKKQCGGCGKFYLPQGNYQTVCTACYRSRQNMGAVFQ